MKTSNPISSADATKDKAKKTRSLFKATNTTLCTQFQLRSNELSFGLALAQVLGPPIKKN